VALYCLGPRAWDALCATPGQPGGCWQWSGLNRAAGTLRYIPRKTGQELRVPIPPVLAERLETFRHRSSAIFPVTTCRGDVYRQWTRIKAAAGIPASGPETVHFHDLRRTCQTEWDALLPGLGDFILGHAPRGVGETWYRNFSRHARKNAALFPLPATFARPT
jgi:integrase